MHISLGFLWLCFQIIHGEITRCSMGGLHYEEDLCKTLIAESVFNRFYISSFQSKIPENNKNMNDVYDTPYNGFKENTEIKAVTSTPVIKHLVNKLLFRSENELINDDIIFRQSIIVDDYNQIDTQWNDALSIGTDTYRLKYHNILLTKYKSGTIELSSKAFMVLIQSYYNAASTHYFSRNYETAQILIEEGLIFFESELKQLKDDVGISNDNLEVWNALFLTLKEDIENIINNKNIEAVNQQSNLNKILLLNKEIIPSSAALFFRRYFLDHDMDATVKSIVESWSPKYKEWESIENYDMYNKNISMHYFLMFSIFGKKVEDRVGNIIKAIQRPVLCVEDRLLNYEANKLALEMLHHCMEETTEWASKHNSSCIELNTLTTTNNVLMKTIIPKLTAESYLEFHKKNPIKELYNSLSTQDMIINQKVLHVIVTAAIDFIDINSEKYMQIKANIKLAIKFLKKYVEGQMQKLKKNEKTDNIIISDIKKKEIENNKTNNICESESGKSSIDESTDNFFETNTSFNSLKDEHNEINELKENIDAYDLPPKNINYDTEEYMKAVYSTDYSIDGIRIKNIFIAFKWLAELNGVLSNNSEPDILHYQKELKSSIDRATNFASNYKDSNYVFANEDHFKYLRFKRKAKILAPISHWEVTSWPGGWIPSKKNTITLVTLDYTTLKDKQSEMFFHLGILKHNSDCPYINKIELNILLYRYVKKTYPGQYDKMYPYIKQAINEVVITSEDRVRNMEAHELFSRYLMQRNRNAIEKGIKLSSYELYKNYLKPPIDEEKINGPIEPEMDEKNL